MGCVLQIGDVKASGQPTNGGYLALDIDLSVQQCSNIEISVTSGGTVIAQSIVNGVGGSFVQNVTLTQSVKCDENVRVGVSCLDDPDCVATKPATILCNTNPCCIPLSVSYADGGCVGTTADRLIEFTISGSVTSVDCLPYVLQIEFGDTIQGLAHVINATGPFTITESHPYDTASTSYVATVKQILHPDCLKQTIDIRFDSCAADCCPVVTETSAVVSACQPGCVRTVTLHTDYSPYQSPCSAATLGWEIRDAGGNVVDDSGPMSTGLPGPHSYTSIALSAADSPYTAILKTFFPTGCADHVLTFDIPECSQDPKCPENLSVTAVAGECQRQNPADPASPMGRLVTISISGEFFTGCGPGQSPTQLSINFGDGQSQTVTLPAVSGSLTFSTDHFYTNYGQNTITVFVNKPDQCLVTAQTTLNVAECSDITPPIICPPPPPSWCILCAWCHYALKLGGRPAACKGWLLFAGGTIIGYALFAILQKWVSGGLNQDWQNNLGAASIGLSTIIFVYYALKCGACCFLCLLRVSLVFFLIFLLIGILTNTMTWAGAVAFIWTMVGLTGAYLLAVGECKKEREEYQEVLDNCE